jgi:hypothetical protein
MRHLLPEQTTKNRDGSGCKSARNVSTHLAALEVEGELADGRRGQLVGRHAVRVKDGTFERLFFDTKYTHPKLNLHRLHS